MPGFVIPLGLSITDQIPDAYSRLRQLHHVASEPVILFLSRLHYKKGLDYLIPAFVKLVTTVLPLYWQVAVAQVQLK